MGRSGSQGGTERYFKTIEHAYGDFITARGSHQILPKSIHLLTLGFQVCTQYLLWALKAAMTTVGFGSASESLKQAHIYHCPFTTLRAKSNHGGFHGSIWGLFKETLKTPNLPVGPNSTYRLRMEPQGSLMAAPKDL